MGVKVGIVGLPNVGKSTLFNALVRGEAAEVANYPFCTVDPNVGVVEVPDERLFFVAEKEGSQKAVPSVIEVVDIAGLVKNASKGEGLGNQFLAHIREVDAIIQVVRCFEAPEVSHVEGSVDPVRDVEIVDLELIAKDLETVERRYERVQKAAKTGDKRAREELALLERLKGILEGLEPVRKYAKEMGEEEWKYATKELFLLTAKPVVYVANVGEEDLNRETERVKELRKKAEAEGAPLIKLSAELEAQLAELEEEELSEWLDAYGMKETGLKRLVKAVYERLGLITFFTTNEKETRAWAVKRGTKAREASGKIHTDIMEGFIAAEVINFKTYEKVHPLSEAKKRGVVRLEGRDYAIEDGDIVFFRFQKRLSS